MSTAPQSPVRITPPLPTRRNAELALLCFATLITGVALLIVHWWSAGRGAKAEANK